MKRVARRFALCLDNAGNEASLILGKVYRIVPDARAAKDDLLRVIDESGEDYLFAKEQFAFVNLPQAVKRSAAEARRAETGRRRFMTGNDDAPRAGDKLQPEKLWR